MSIIWIIIVCIIILVTLVAFFYMYTFNETIGVRKIINNAVTDSQYLPTIMQIYDRSTSTICDRLIIIKPFNWYLWAINNNLYILNPEAGRLCPQGYVSAIQVFSDRFIEICINMPLTGILQHYQLNQTPITVEYTINKNTFTILSAINLLTKKYITFEADFNKRNNDDNNSIKPELRTITTTQQQNQKYDYNRPIGNVKMYGEPKRATIIKQIPMDEEAPKPSKPNKHFVNIKDIVNMFPRKKTHYTHTQLITVYRTHAAKPEKPQHEPLTIEEIE